VETIKKKKREKSSSSSSSSSKEKIKFDTKSYEEVKTL